MVQALGVGVRALLLSHAFAAALKGQKFLNMGKVQVLQVCSCCACTAIGRGQ